MRIGVLDLVTSGPAHGLYSKLMNANLASIMPQVIGAWCEEAGHEVRFVCYTGYEDLSQELPANTDLLFISSFTEAAQLSYAISAMYRQRGTITVLGGPHARCYPEDASRYFDYVCGFTDKALVNEVLADCEQHRPIGVTLSAHKQPAQLPSVRERWKFIEVTLKKAPTIKIVPMLASLGCPYTCSFCIDSTVDYQPFDPNQTRDDLRFLMQNMKRPRIGWHDPNFGVRFDETLGAIEDAIKPGSADFIAESSLSLLNEDRLPRLKKNGFAAILPGIESWFSLGNKAKTGKHYGMEKVRQVSEHVNMVMRYIPYVQTNFVLGLDTDEGPEPFECTKRFIDLTPGAFPGYSLLSAFGRAAPLNLELQRAGRVLPFPFHFLNNNLAMNVKPKNYSWETFYDHVIDLTTYSFSGRAIWNRFKATGGTIPKWMNVVRAVSSEGWGRLKYYKHVRELLSSDASVRKYFAAETDTLPTFYENRIKNDLGPFWDKLPAGALMHDPNAYLNAERERVTRGAEAPTALTVNRTAN